MEHDGDSVGRDVFRGCDDPDRDWDADGDGDGDESTFMQIVAGGEADDTPFSGLTNLPTSRAKFLR